MENLGKNVCKDKKALTHCLQETKKEKKIVCKPIESMKLMSILMHITEIHLIYVITLFFLFIYNKNVKSQQNCLKVTGWVILIHQ